MRLAARLALGLPGLTRLGDGLIRASLILAPQWDAYRFGDVIYLYLDITPLSDATPHGFRSSSLDTCCDLKRRALTGIRPKPAALGTPVKTIKTLRMSPPPE